MFNYSISSAMENMYAHWILNEKKTKILLCILWFQLHIHKLFLEIHKTLTGYLDSGIYTVKIFFFAFQNILIFFLQWTLLFFKRENIFILCKEHSGITIHSCSHVRLAGAHKGVRTPTTTDLEGRTTAGWQEVSKGKSRRTSWSVAHLSWALEAG